MKIVFFGTGEFSTTILKGLINDKQNVVAVVTQTDKVNARNNKVVFSSIKKYCLENNLPLYQFEKLNLEGEDVLKSYNPDLFVTASYGQIIKQNILDIPKFGTVNVHASLLPKYRGPAPIQGAILNGEKKTGITIMKTDIGCDTGDIYFSREIKIEDDDTSTSVFNKLATLGVECMAEFLNNFDKYKDAHFPQDNSKATYFPMIKKEDYLLDFNTCSFDLCNKIRALENCYFIYKGMRFKVMFAVPNDKTGEPGEILACNGKSGLIIATKDRSIEVVTIQPEGKQKMFAIQYMNSNKFTLGDIIENK
ncbi:MAG: methionyl-tRNA formyltransferase [Clostridia bacterium]|nr:methionyl-tRNA formyltransferase [Clostridia bacterium]